MDSDHGIPVPPGQHSHPGPSQSPDLVHDQNHPQLHQSIEQQLLASGSSSISDFISMLPQTASLNSGISMASPDYRASCRLLLSSIPIYAKNSSLNSTKRSSHSIPVPSHSSDSHQGSADPDDRGEMSTSSIGYTTLEQGNRFSCSLCGRVVVSKVAIKRHIQVIHEKKKPYECSICHRRFGYYHVLVEHQNNHFGMKPYACTVCDKRFAKRSSLFEHRRIHKQPFCCYICNRHFLRDEKLKKHFELLHPTAKSCSQCPFTASNVEALNQHIKENHKLLIHDSNSGDPTFQVVVSLPSSTLTSPDKSQGLMSLTMDSSDPICRIESVYSQFDNSGQGHHLEDGSQKEPLSPGGVKFPPEPSHHHFPFTSPFSRDHHHFNHGSTSSTITSSSLLPQFFATQTLLKLMKKSVSEEAKKKTYSL